MVVTQNWVASRLPENFHRPLDFLPDRWLKIADVKNKSKVNSFVVLPFGHGMRGCIARRFAEQNMLLTMIKVRVGTRNSFKTLKFIFLYSWSAAIK